MRKIKFRGKRIDNGEWVYGFYVEGASNGSNRILKHGIAEYGSYPVEVDPETVGQYTGKTAQCVDEIFEGDNCEVTTFDHNGNDYQHKCVVKYIDGAFVFVNVEKEFYLPLYLVEDTDSDIEVTGNIYDNPSEV